MINKFIRNRVLLATIISTTAFTSVGCNINSDTPVIGRLVGLKDNEVIKIGSNICSTEEAKLLLMDIQNQYKKDFGGEINWEQQVGNITMGEYVLNKVKSDLSIVYAMSALATEKEYEITKEEQELISNAAKEYCASLTDAEKSYADVTTETVEKLYTNYYLADKLYEEKTGSITESISDEEARVIKIQYIYIDTTKTDVAEARSTLEQVKKQVENGYQDFLVQASKHGDNEVYELNIKKNEADKAYQLKAFELDDDTISEVIEDTGGLYLIKCVDGYLESATNENKIQMTMENKINAINSAYTSYIKDNSKDFNKEAWNKLTLSDNPDVKASNLFEIYDKYLSVE